MRTELTKLNAFLGTWSDLEDLFIKHADFDDCMAFIHLTCHDLQKSIELHIDQLSTDIEISKYVQSAQRRLVHLADHSANLALELKAVYSEPLPERREIAVLVNEINILLIKTLDYLHVYFAKHFDHAARLPVGYTFQDNLNTSVQLLKVIEGLHANEVDNNLLVLLDCFLNQLEHKDNHLIKTWKQYDYIYDLSFELVAFVKEENRENGTSKLIKLLIALDFNHVRFYTYMVSYVKELESGNLSFLEQQILLNDLLLQFKSIRLERKEGFNPDIMPIRDTICGMLKNKIKHLEKSKGLHYQKSEKSESKKSSEFYFCVSSTIEELLFLTWIMVEVRFIKTKFNAHIYAFVENHIRAEYTKHPSPAYMRNHFGNKDVPGKVVRKVREWLQRMIWFIDEHFKEQLKG